MDSPPFVSLLHFYQRFSPSGKKLFTVLMVFCLFGAAWWGWGMLLGPAAGVVYQPQEETFPSVLSWLPAQDTDTPLAELKAKAYARFALQIPGFLMPSRFSIWLLLTSMVLFWAGALTVASKMKKYWNLLPPFLFAIWLSQLNLGITLTGVDPLYLVTLAICLAFFLPLYYFQYISKYWSTSIVFLLFTALMIGLFAALWGIRGEGILFQTIASASSYHYLLACLALILASKEILSLVTAFLINRQEAHSRPGLQLLLFTWVLVILFLSIWLLGLEQVFSPSLQSVLPVIIACIACLAWPFTAQNAFHVAKSAFGSNLAYTLSIVLMGLNAIFFFGYAATNGDYLLQLQAFRLITFIFPLVAVLQTIYWLVNFYEAFQQRKNTYFILHMPIRIRFIIVWLAVAIITVIAEGKKSWKSFQIMAASSYSRSADYFLLESEADSALVRYGQALTILSGDPKSNYNAGILMLKPGKSPLPALEKLQSCSRSYEAFTAGEIQAATYYAFVGKHRLALEILRKAKERTSDREVPNMMAWLYLKLDQPDSAVICLKESLVNDPSYAEASSNLGMIYLRYNRANEAIPFFEMAKESGGNQPGPMTNLLFASLSGMKDVSISWNPEWIQEDAPASFLQNALIWCSSNGLPDQADKIAELLETRSVNSDILQYKMVRCMQTDSVPQALSRYAWLVKSTPQDAPLAAHNLGAIYHQSGVPEMALRFYQDAATWESAPDMILSGMMLAQLGEQDSAHKMFSKVRVMSPAYQDAARKEIALLLLSNGQELYASLEWNFSDATYQDWMRGASYAAASGNKTWFIEMLRRAIQLDSSQWQPYDRLAQWYLNQNDAEALQAYRDGLEALPGNPHLQAGFLNACYLLNTPQEAEAVRKAFVQPDSAGREGILLKATEQIFARKYSVADTLLQEWLAENPLDTRGLFLLGNLWQLSGFDPATASAYFFNALSMNDRNPGLWKYYAAFSSAAGLTEQAGYGALQAARFTSNPTQKADILNTFASEIQAWRDAEL